MPLVYIQGLRREVCSCDPFDIIDLEEEVELTEADREDILLQLAEQDWERRHAF